MADIIKEIINLFVYPITHEVEAHGKLLTDEEKQDLLEKAKKRYCLLYTSPSPRD